MGVDYGVLVVLVYLEGDCFVDLICWFVCLGGEDVVKVFRFFNFEKCMLECIVEVGEVDFGLVEFGYRFFDVVEDVYLICLVKMGMLIDLVDFDVIECGK